MICSIALARLRTDIKGNDLANSNAVGMAQKLLLFWRKPARRCWWEGVELDNVFGVEGKLKVWIRRVWTLEMVRSASDSMIYVVAANINAERHRPTLTSLTNHAAFFLFVSRVLHQRLHFHYPSVCPVVLFRKTRAFAASFFVIALRCLIPPSTPAFHGTWTGQHVGYP